MNITVLGATGRTGVHVVRQALERGHEVRVLVRDAAKAQRVLGDAADRVEVALGDATDPSAVERAAAGAEAVVSALGPVRGSAPDAMQRSAVATLQAVRQLDRRRLVWLTGAGVARPGDRPSRVDRAVVGVMRLLTPDVLRDSEAAAALVVGADDVDWTLVRAPRLTDRAATGPVRVVDAVGGGHGLTVARAGVGAYLVELAASDGQRHASPVVSA